MSYYFARWHAYCTGRRWSWSWSRKWTDFLRLISQILWISISGFSRGILTETRPVLVRSSDGQVSIIWNQSRGSHANGLRRSSYTTISLKKSGFLSWSGEMISMLCDKSEAVWRRLIRIFAASVSWLLKLKRWRHTQASAHRNSLQRSQLPEAFRKAPLMSSPARCVQ